MMESKGYLAAVEFDDSVGLLHGRVVNSGTYPIATFEAADVDRAALSAGAHGIGLNSRIKQAVEEGIQVMALDPRLGRGS